MIRSAEEQAARSARLQAKLSGEKAKPSPKAKQSAPSAAIPDDEPMVLVDARGERREPLRAPVEDPRLSPEQRAARKVARAERARTQYRPPLAVTSFEDTYGRSSVVATERNFESGGSSGNFVDAAIRAGWIKPKT